MNKMGLWKWDANQFPKYEYTGGYPATAKDRTGRDAAVPKDPCFIMGNHRMTVFAHASGRYEFITGERGWARCNHGGKNLGWNRSILSVARRGVPQEEKIYELVGGLADTDIKTRQSFGVGYANYEYECGGQVKITKVISVQPSMECGRGNASLLLEVAVENMGTEPIEIAYQEQLLANYRMMTHQEENDNTPGQRLQYVNQLSTDPGGQLVKAEVLCKPVKLLLLPESPEQNFPYDCFPPQIFMKVAETTCGNTWAETDKNGLGELLCGGFELSLNAGESNNVRMVIGCSFSQEEQAVKEQIEDMLKKAGMETGGSWEASVEPAGRQACAEGAYSHLWKRVLPDLSDEKEEEFRCEMLWNAYVLECMATYNQYFRETYIPQGSVYAYHLGQNASNRDHLQHMLPLVYTNPELAKSCLRFAMKHTLETGEICRQDVGFGYRDPGVYMESDAQLYMFMAVGEYLRVTKDYGFLEEEIPYYPVEYGRTDTVLHVLTKHFIYLRDVVSTGQHGLVRMLNSDWSDSFFHPYSPNIYCGCAESHMNTTMVLAILPALMRALGQYADGTNAGREEALYLAEEMKQYREEIYTAFLKDMEGRTFAPRCYIGWNDEPELKFGLDTLCLEAQTFLLQMEDFPAERKKRLIQEIKNRVLDMEKRGARTREVPLWDKKGCGEDGGIWFSHQGALITGMAAVDRKEAAALLKKLTFHQYAGDYPEYWLGHWTYADSLESTLSDREGLYHFWVDDAFQPFCAHAHAWMLYCYYRLYRQR